MKRTRLLRPALVAAAVALCTLATVPPAHAQLSNLDTGILVDELGKRNMSDLLIHLSSTEEFTDPVVPLQIQVAQARIRFRDESLPMPERIASLEQGLETMRRLISEHFDNPLRPMWQTDLAEILMYDYLRSIHNSAAEFYEFGVPTAEQKAAFESAAVEMLEIMTEADLMFFRLQGDLPRRPDFTERFENTNLFERLINQYWKRRTQFYLGHAALYVLLLPDDSDYFQDLKNEHIPRQGANPAAERQRLQQQILDNEHLQALLNDQSDDAGVRQPVASLVGRVQAQAGQAQEGLDTLAIVTSTNPPDLVGLIAGLGRAFALDRLNQTNVALDQISDLRGHTLVQPIPAGLIYRLLLTDARHRLLLRQAQKAPPAERPAAIANAYQPYLELINNRELGEHAENLKFFIYNRWADALAQGQDLTELPPVVPMAIGEMTAKEGQNAMVEALGLEASGASEQEVTQQQTAARQELMRARQVTEQLLQRPDLDPAIRANAMFHLGLATYFHDVNDTATIVKAAGLLTDLARDLTDQPQAEQAIAFAEAMLRDLLQRAPSPAVSEQYEITAGVLFDKYASSTAADDARLYYAFNVLRPQDKFEEAAAILERVPFNHPSYWQARRERLYMLLELYRRVPEERKVEIQQALEAEAQRLIGDGESAESTTSADERRIVEDAVANAKLVLVDLAIASGEYDKATDPLQNFEEQYAEHEDLVREAQQKRIGVYVAADQPDQMVEAARQMMEFHPDDAAAVINGLLTNMEREIDQLRRQAEIEMVDREKEKMLARSRVLADAAVKLAEMLRDWAFGQDLPAEEMAPYELIYAKSLRLAGQYDAAIRVIEPLLERYPNDREMIHNAAEAYFATGDREALINRAAPLFDQLIAGIQETPYPPEYWNAWMRRLQINDVLGEMTQEIPLRVRQLEMLDPTLGGEPYKGELKRLELKHGTGALAPLSPQTQTAEVVQVSTDSSAVAAAAPSSSRGITAGRLVIGLVAVLVVGATVAFAVLQKMNARRPMRG